MINQQVLPTSYMNPYRGFTVHTVFCREGIPTKTWLYKPFNFMGLQRHSIRPIWYESCTVNSKAWAGQCPILRNKNKSVYLDQEKSA